MMMGELSGVEVDEMFFMAMMMMGELSGVE